MAPKHFLNNISIPSPCTADWNSMIGNDQVRFCGHCNLDVHNLSQMTRSQAERLVSRSNGRLCVRYHQDPAGQPLTLPARRKLHRIGRRVSKRVSRIAAGAFTATLSVTSVVAQGSPNPHSVSFNPATASQNANRFSLGSSFAGTITDESGALIAGATISLWNQRTEAALYTSTDSEGQFKFDSLEAGAYKLRIEAQGFVANEEGSVYLQPNSEARVDRTLRVSVVGEVLEVLTEPIALGGAVVIVAPEDPFVRAAQEDDLDALTALIAGQDVDLRDERSGTTALEHAVKNANREMVQLLLSSGANVNAKNEAGETVLMMLDEDSTSDLVWDLINAGADVNHQNDYGNTPLMRATENLEALKTLIEAGAQVNTKNKDGSTALMQAAGEGSVNAVRALILAGADINAVNEEEDSALDLAIENDHQAVVRLLKSKGALQTIAQAKKEE